MRHAFSLCVVLVLPFCRIALAATLIAPRGLRRRSPSLVAERASTRDLLPADAGIRREPRAVGRRLPLQDPRRGDDGVRREERLDLHLIEERKERPTDPDSSPIVGQGDPGVRLERGVSRSGCDFVGSAGAERVVPGARSSGVHNYFLGNDPARWRTDLPLYEGVRLSNVWPGVDVGVRIEHGHFEYDVFVEPGADLSQVAFDVEGAEGLRLAADGDAPHRNAARTGSPDRVRRLGRSWTTAGESRCVRLRHPRREALRVRGSRPWITERPLVIDPGLIYATYLGGGNR